MATSTGLEGLNLACAVAVARAIARLQGRCPGIPVDGGGFSGCRGLPDCPVCEGRRVEELTWARDSKATITALEAEVIELTGCDSLSEMPVALAEDPSILRTWLGRALRRGHLEAEAARAERDVLRAAARALLAARDAFEPGSAQDFGAALEADSAAMAALRALLPQEGL